MESHEMSRKLWEHPDPKNTSMYRLMQEINKRYGVQLRTFHELYDFSVTHRSKFWDLCFHFLGLIYTGSYDRVVDEDADIDTMPRWFDGVYLNMAENLLYSRTHSDESSTQSKRDKEDSKIAVTEVREGGSVTRNVTWGKLRMEVGELSSAMRAHGVTKGNRIAIVASNSVDTLEVFLATTALGGIVSTSSTDVGTKGVLDRLLQIEPKYIFMDDWAIYNGQKVDLRQKMTEIANGMKEARGFAGVVSMPRFPKPADISDVPNALTLGAFVSKATSKALLFEKTAFGDPLMIVYSSGTTGMPKCIVHSIGGCLISTAKEEILHREKGPDSVVLQYTTTGWIMYYGSIANLLCGARVVLYDGSPFQPDRTTLIKLAGSQRVTMLGVSPRWLGEIKKNSIVPKNICDLSNLKTVLSTGMVLSNQIFTWFYDTAFPSHVHLANISGGTDIAGCFGLENPLTAVHVGGTQGPCLGTPIAVFDSRIKGGRGVKGAAVLAGVPGELVATAAFPNMPLRFWNDPTGEKYYSAYFEKYHKVWTHGDFVLSHPVTRQLVFLGRSDGVLNPSGVRFGSAEIYSVLEAWFPQVSDSICVGQRRPQDEDESVMLFLLMGAGEKFTQKLVADVKAVIRRELSARHVPKYVFDTPALPMTVNLKKVELPVKQIVSGQTITPSGTLLNPDSLRYFYQFAKVEELVASKPKL